MKTSTTSFLIVMLLGILCCQDQYPDTEKNKEIVADAFKVVGSGDYENMDMYIADNYVRHCQATPGLEISTLSEFKEFIRQDRLAIPDQHLDIKKLIAEGEFVAFWASYKGTQTGQMGPFPLSNKYAELDFSGMHRIENGKIAETWITWDNISILSQLGHFPPAPPAVNGE